MTTITQEFDVSDSPMPVDDGPDRYVIGVQINGMFIYDPFRSECGRFDVDPSEAYGLTEKQAHELASLNAMINAATIDAIRAGRRSVQEALGHAPISAVFFPNEDECNQVGRTVAHYVLSEVQAWQAALQKSRPITPKP